MHIHIHMIFSYGNWRWCRLTFLLETSSDLLLEHFEKKKSPKIKAFSGMTTSFRITFHSGSSFCGGLTVQFWGPAALLESFPRNVDQGQAPRGVLRCPPRSLRLDSKPRRLIEGSEFGIFYLNSKWKPSRLSIVIISRLILRFSKHWKGSWMVKDFTVIWLLYLVGQGNLFKSSKLCSTEYKFEVPVKIFYDTNLGWTPMHKPSSFLSLCFSQFCQKQMGI